MRALSQDSVLLLLLFPAPCKLPGACRHDSAVQGLPGQGRVVQWSAGWRSSLEWWFAEEELYRVAAS